MATTSSSSSRALLILACLAATTAQGAGTHGVAATCPSQQEGSPLNGATVFDGPPVEKTDLMPDTTRHRGGQVESSWNVRYVYEQKREVFLTCQYAGHAEPLIVRIPQPVAACTYRTADPGKPVEMRCR